jgi:bacillopeptidase F (M6 metalloprotease family)
VRVVDGPGRSNMTTWHSPDNGGVAAHETGHMFGHPDEYGDAACPDREPVNTGSIMHMTTGDVPQRLMTRFAENIGSSVVGI